MGDDAHGAMVGPLSFRALGGEELTTSARARSGAIAAKRQHIQDEIAEARKQIAALEQKETAARDANQLPGGAAGPADTTEADELQKHEKRKAHSKTLEEQLHANKAIVASMQSEAATLAQEKQQLVGDKAVATGVMAKALDTPLQSAMYTIKDMLHEEGVDDELRTQLSKILKQLSNVHVYMPTFNFSSTGG